MDLPVAQYKNRIGPRVTHTIRDKYESLYPGMFPTFNMYIEWVKQNVDKDAYLIRNKSGVFWKFSDNSVKQIRRFNQGKAAHPR